MLEKKFTPHNNYNYNYNYDYNYDYNNNNKDVNMYNNGHGSNNNRYMYSNMYNSNMNYNDDTDSLNIVNNNNNDNDDDTDKSNHMLGQERKIRLHELLFLFQYVSDPQFYFSILCSGKEGYSFFLRHQKLCALSLTKIPQTFQQVEFINGFRCVEFHLVPSDVKTIEPLAEIKVLYALDLSFCNELTDFTPLRKLTQLR
eukprot:Awhi_evm1s8147